MNSLVAKPMGTRPTMVAYHGRLEAGGTLRTSHQSPNARAGAAMEKPVSLSSGYRGLPFRLRVEMMLRSMKRGIIPKTKPTAMARKSNEDCGRVRPKLAYITGRASVNRYMRAHPVALMMLTTNTIGSVKKSRTGRLRATLVNVAKEGVRSGLLILKYVMSVWALRRISRLCRSWLWRLSLMKHSRIVRTAVVIDAR